MRRLATLLLLAAALAVTAAAAERAWTPETVPNVRLTDVRRHVSDPAGLLSPAARDSTDRALHALERHTGIETAVAVVPSTGDMSLFDFSHALFRRWGIGRRGRDDGLLIVIDAGSRHVRFTTGYGLEGALPDAICKRIQLDCMRGPLSRGRIDSALVAGTGAVVATLWDAASPTPQTRRADDGDTPTAPLLFVAAAVIGFVLLARYMARRQRRCPHCGKEALRQISADVYRRADGRRWRRTTAICGHCGHVVTRETPLDGDPPSGGGTGAMLTGLFLGSMLGRGGGGGSFGGHFGGGSTGGGGAET